MNEYLYLLTAKMGSLSFLSPHAQSEG